MLSALLAATFFGGPTFRWIAIPVFLLDFRALAMRSFLIKIDFKYLSIHFDLAVVVLLAVELEDGLRGLGQVDVRGSREGDVGLGEAVDEVCGRPAVLSCVDRVFASALPI